MNTCRLSIFLLLIPACLCAGPCVTGTLQDYINLGAGGCQWNGATFSDFATVPGQNFATPIAPSSVQVTPANASPLARLMFTLNADAQAGEFFESIFRFHVAAAQLDAASLLMGDLSTATTDGAAIASANICPNAVYPGDSPTGCPNAEDQMVVVVTEGLSSLSDSRIYALTSFFDVFADITIDGGVSGTAHLDWAAFEATTQDTTQVPEPATALLTICGAGFIALFRRCLIR